MLQRQTGDVVPDTDICSIIPAMEHSDDNEPKMQYFSTTEYSGGDMYAYNNVTPAPPKAPSKRPGVISFICILGFIAGMIGLLVALTMPATGLPDWYRPFAVLGVAVSFIGYIGTWKMKKWGMYLLILMFLVSVIVAYATDLYSIASIAGSALIVLIIIFNSGKME